MIESRTFNPDWISPPGDTIEDLLEERNWTQAELAKRTGFTPKHVNELVKGKATLTPDAARRLSSVLGAPVEFWLVREAKYQAALERQRREDIEPDEKAWLEQLPVSFMIRVGWIESHRRLHERFAACLQFFGVASVAAWQERYARPLAAFRASGKHPKKLGAVAAWLRRGELETTAVRSEPFDKEEFRRALGDLRGLTREADPKVFVPQLVASCAAHGVAVALVPAPGGCPVSGATQWLSPEKAMLLLSLRHKTNDHLWFTFFHEAGHLILHGKKILRVEGLEGLDDAAEDEANRFAGDMLIPEEAAKRLAALRAAKGFSEATVRSFAAEVGVAPGIVVGRLQNSGSVPWSHFNRLKARYAWA
ncbi:MAG TPA: helix-turn-helix domain-containing protein [Thermoanaerobaculia bacterium]|jgi:addiction module HigA family antidote|nr:helix-turn-helix domain-containing protein [Thermoanaerobaculia bacterium]